MSKLIEIAGLAGDRIWVNPAHIIRVMSAGEGRTRLLFTAPGEDIVVAGAADEMVAKLNHATD